MIQIALKWLVFLKYHKIALQLGFCPKTPVCDML